MKLKTIISGILLFCAISVHAQSVIKGRVVEKTIKEKQSEGGNVYHHLSPLMGVNLYWMGTTSGTSTDSLGLFELRRVEPFNCSVCGV